VLRTIQLHQGSDATCRSSDKRSSSSSSIQTLLNLVTLTLSTWQLAEPLSKLLAHAAVQVHNRAKCQHDAKRIHSRLSYTRSVNAQIITSLSQRHAACSMPNVRAITERLSS
jgi:hypothetical protein